MVSVNFLSAVVLTSKKFSVNILIANPVRYRKFQTVDTLYAINLQGFRALLKTGVFNPFDMTILNTRKQFSLRTFTSTNAKAFKSVKALRILRSAIIKVWPFSINFDFRESQ